MALAWPYCHFALRGEKQEIPVAAALYASPLPVDHGTGTYSAWPAMFVHRCDGDIVLESDISVTTLWGLMRLGHTRALTSLCQLFGWCCDCDKSVGNDVTLINIAQQSDNAMRYLHHYDNHLGTDLTATTLGTDVTLLATHVTVAYFWVVMRP